MAAKQMVDVDTGAGVRSEFDETITTGNGDWIIIPEGVASVMVALTPGSGASGKIQYTTEGIAKVLDDTAVGHDWDSGTVSVYTDDVLYPVTAIRLVSVSGSVRMTGGAV